MHLVDFDMYFEVVFNQWSNGGGMGTNEDTNSGGTMGFSYTRTQIDSNGNILSGCIEGCTDELACNYNSDANSDDDTCEYPNTNADCNGDCLDGFVLVQGGGNGSGTGNGDGSGQCVSILEGCTDELACNYNSDANTDDDTCEYPNTNADCNGDCLDGFVLVQGGGNGNGTGNGDGSGQCISILELY